MNDVSHLEPATPLNSAAKVIFDWIISSDLAPGDVLPIEQELADRFKMARGTVREALRELRALGIVHVRRGLGTYVCSPAADTIRPALVFRAVKSPLSINGGASLSGLRELVEVRMLLECSLIAEVTGTIPATTGARLVELAERMDGTASHAEDDREFHQLLYASVDNALARELIDVCWDAFHLAQGSLPAKPVRATRQQHLDIATCVMGHDPLASQAAMRQHFDDIRDRLSSS